MNRKDILTWHKSLQPQVDNEFLIIFRQTVPAVSRCTRIPFWKARSIILSNFHSIQISHKTIVISHPKFQRGNIRQIKSSINGKRNTNVTGLAVVSHRRSYIYPQIREVIGISIVAHSQQSRERPCTVIEVQCRPVRSRCSLGIGNNSGAGVVFGQKRNFGSCRQMDVHINILIGSRSTTCDRGNTNITFRIGISPPYYERSIPFITIISSRRTTSFRPFIGVGCHVQQGACPSTTT